MAETRSCTAHCADFIQVHDHCAERAYVELEIPADAAAVLKVTFSISARDQGELKRLHLLQVRNLD